jgi:hypothetical protein
MFFQYLLIFDPCQKTLQTRKQLVYKNTYCSMKLNKWCAVTVICLLMETNVMFIDDTSLRMHLSIKYHTARNLALGDFVW